MKGSIQRQQPTPPPQRRGMGLSAAVVIGRALVVRIQLGAIP